jgi:UDP-N-acetylmuramoylalanine--D-glutamate ligase
LDLDSEKSLHVAKAFAGLPHRLEFVGDVGGVHCYEDSIGTTPDSALAAVRAFDEPVVAIMGGHDNGSRYGDMAAHLAHQKNLKAVVLIGEVAPQISNELNSHGPPGSVHVVIGAKSMDAAVGQALTFTQSGDVVLLAPGAQSFGMFKNYQDRGDQFRAAVERRIK